MSDNVRFAQAMSELQNKVQLSRELVQAVVIAHQVSNETVEAIADCVSGAIDVQQFVSFITRVLQRVGK